MPCGSQAVGRYIGETYFSDALLWKLIPIRRLIVLGFTNSGIWERFNGTNLYLDELDLDIGSNLEVPTETLVFGYCLSFKKKT